MKLVHAAAAVLNQTPLDWNGNQRRVSAAIAEARERGVSVLCLPEMCLTGYGCEDAFLSAATHEMAERLLLELLPETRGMIVSFGLPRWHAGGVINAACLVADGQILGFVGKQNLAGEGIHYEPRWFRPWPEGVCSETLIDGRPVPIGDLVFDCGGVRIGYEICEDAWVANRPGGELARRGVDVILNPSASHFAFGKHEIRKRFVLEGSRAFNVSYVYSNLLGNESGRAIYDGGAMIASAGRLLAAGPRFSYADCQLTAAVLDIETTRMNRARSRGFAPSPDRIRTGTITAPFDFPATPLVQHSPELPDWERSPTLKEEEFARAVPLALFDYLRKSRSRGFVVSLSGGADSATVAMLCSMLVEFGTAELGRESFLHKLDHIPSIESATSASEIVARLLACVYQATRNSSEVTRTAADGLAAALGAEFLEFDVDAIVQQYIEMVAAGIGRPLTWDRDDIALQNIQARVRSPGVWLLANLRNALLLSTSNRSEAAVGYATMDGDTSGGLSPIAGIDKAFLLSWLEWMERMGPEGSSPCPALAAINQQQPTAELRPPDSKQTDETDLMPYEILDTIERAAIRDKRSPIDVLHVVQSCYPSEDRQQLGAWVTRFFRLWCRNQWKRERYAPSFHLDDENLDPKTWCRFPILSGGYERELSELQALLDKERETP